MKQKSHYKITEVAKLLDVTRVTVWRWCKDGKLPHVVLPSGQIRIPHGAVDEFMNAGIGAYVGAQLNEDGTITITAYDPKDMSPSDVTIQLYDVDALYHRLYELKTQAGG